jgi:glycosyltransferase involved in cell wall biosynthesis
MKITILAEDPQPNYFRPLVTLHERGEIQEIEFMGLRDVLQKRTFSKPQPDEIIVCGCSPYHPILYGLAKAILCGSPTVISTSWPYSDPSLAVHRWKWPGFTGIPLPDLPVRKSLWRWCVQETTAVGITEAARCALEKFNPSAVWIPHAVDIDQYIPTDEPSGPFRLLYLGRLVPEKGISRLIQLAERWKEKAKSHRLIVAGSGPLRKEIITARDSGLSIHYLGKVCNPWKLFPKVNALILPSQRVTTERNGKQPWEELFGIVLLESMACGRPVISVDHFGPREIISHGEDGFILEENDLEGMENAVDELAENARLRRAMGMNGRAKVEKTFNLKEVSHQWKKLLRNL